MRAASYLIITACLLRDNNPGTMPAYHHLGVRWWFILAGITTLTRARTDIKYLLHGQGESNDIDIGEPLYMTALRSMLTMALVAPCTAVCLSMRLMPSSSSYDPLRGAATRESPPPPPPHRAGGGLRLVDYNLQFFF